MTSRHVAPTKRRSRLWYLLPIFLHIIGGLIAYFVLRGSDDAIAKNSLWLGIILSAVATTLALAVYLAYLNDMTAARERISTAQVIGTAYGPIQYADVGHGTPVLMIHGAGGGFDQGLLTATSFMGNDITNTHRAIAPSRFGYLKTPMPSTSGSSDASPAAQADAHAALLDALGISQRVTVVGASAGALSAAEFAVKYPDRVSVLVLAIPAAWSPESAANKSAAEIGSNDFIMENSETKMEMNTKIPDLQSQMLRMGSVAFLAGIVIILASTLIHPSREDPANHPLVFAEYAEDDLWVASHLGQFAGVMLVFVGGFVALFRLLVKSESGTASALGWLGLVAAIITASTFTILQAVDGIALKIAVDTWYAIPPSSPADSEEEKAVAFQVAEGIRWTEIGINSYFRIFQGTVAVIFGVAIAISKLLSRWIGGLGIFAGAVAIIAGVGVAYEGFSTSQALLSVVSTVISLAWLVILGIFMWRKTRVKIITK